MQLSTFLIQLLNSIQYGMLLFLIASGLTLTFGVMGIINLAHGAFFMIGAYLAFQFTRLWGWPLPAAYAGAVLAVVILGACVERTILAPLANRDHLDQVLVTYGLILIMEQLRSLLVGDDVHGIAVPKLFDFSIPLTETLSYPVYRLLMSAICLVVALLMALVIQRTRLGMTIRAGASNREMVAVLGIDVGSVYRVVFALGVALAAFAGMIDAPAASVAPGMGNQILIVSFVVVVIGGIGSIKGAFLGSLLIGLADTFGKVYAPAISGMTIYMLMAAVLLWRPAGLFGRA
jgi:branched-chain amino acid transport system permease protein